MCCGLEKLGNCFRLNLGPIYTVPRMKLGRAEIRPFQSSVYENNGLVWRPKNTGPSDGPSDFAPIFEPALFLDVFNNKIYITY